MRIRIMAAVVFIGMTSGLSPAAFSALAPWHQDELVKHSDVIAIIEIHERFPPQVEGLIHDKDGKEFSTALISYSSNSHEVIFGRISKCPLLIQFDSAGCIDLLEKGKYILFLKSEGHLFTPLAAFKINGDKVDWYKKPFFTGDYGPEIGEIPLSNAVQNIKQIIEKFKTVGNPSEEWKH